VSTTEKKKECNEKKAAGGGPIIFTYAKVSQDTPSNHLCIKGRRREGAGPLNEEEITYIWETSGYHKKKKKKTKKYYSYARAIGRWIKKERKGPVRKGNATSTTKKSEFFHKKSGIQSAERESTIRTKFRRNDFERKRKGG